MKLIGVLLAAGRSTRMGRLKQLLPWPPDAPDGKPLVAAAFDAIAGVCDAMVVVVSHEAETVVAALGDRTFRDVRVEAGAEMIESVKAGLRATREIDSSAAVLLHPADHPVVRRDALEAIVSAATEKPDRAVMPEHRGQGGHPALIPSNVAELICGYNGPGGLRQFWLTNPDRCVRLQVNDPGVVCDIDAPIDYDVRKA